MKRSAHRLLALALCLSALSGCARQPVQRVTLSEENLWQYVAVAPTADFVPAQSDAPLVCCVRGVLDYALYEDVLLTFEVVYYKPESPNVPDQKSYTVSVALNAAGGAQFEVPYTGLAQIKNGVGSIRDYGDSAELYWFNRTLRLTGVTGTVCLTP